MSRRWMQISPKPGMINQVLKKLSLAGVHSFERDGSVYARIGKRHIGWVQRKGFGGLGEKIDELIEEWSWLTGDPSIIPAPSLEGRWKIATKHLHRTTGLRLLEYLFERSLRENKEEVEIHPNVTYTESRLGTVGQVYSSLRILDERKLIKITSRPATGERGMPWRVQISPEMLEVYRIKKASGEVETQLPTRETQVSKISEPRLLGTAVVHIDISFKVPADLGTGLAHYFGTWLTEVSKKKMIKPEGGVTCSIQLEG